MSEGTAIPSAEAVPRKAIPKGVVLGKDGKPCRSCTSFASWASNTKQQTSKSSRAATSGTLTAASAAAAAAMVPADCPPDVEQLGRSSWTLLHSIAANYPSRPSFDQESQVKSFIGLFSKVYPCWVCAEDFQEYISKVGGVKAASRDEFGKWLCEAHNDVNRKLGKKEFDCSRWEERWRTGWNDGSCD